MAFQTKSDVIIKNGLDAADVLLKSRKNTDYRVHETTGILCFRYGESFKSKGIRFMENSIPTAKMNHVSGDTIKRLEEQLKKYREMR